MNFLHKLLGAIGVEHQPQVQQQGAPLNLGQVQGAATRGAFTAGSQVPGINVLQGGGMQAQNSFPIQPRLNVSNRFQTGNEYENAGSPFGFGNPDGTDYSNVQPFDTDTMASEPVYQLPMGIGRIQGQNNRRLRF